MNISEIAIRRPVLAWMLMISLILFGWLAFREMGISQLPDVDFPVVSISTSLEGASPEVMETEVVDLIENAVISVEGITSMSSTMRPGSASVSLEFDLDKNLDVAVQEIQTKLVQIQRRFPQDTEVPSVSKSNPEDQPIMWLAVASDKMSRRDLMSFVRDQLRTKFLTVPGVADINLGGLVDPAMRVDISQEKLSRYAMTVADVVAAIKSEHLEVPAGRIENKDRELSIRSMSEARSAEELADIPIARRGGSPVFSQIYLRDLAQVEDGLADARRRSRAMGAPAVGLGIKKQRGANAVAVAKAIKQRLIDIKTGLPEGVDIGVNFDSTKFIEESIQELNFTIILAAILTAFVCWLFLGSVSATINVILAIPTSIIGTFIVLKAMHFTLNLFTLLGLSLAIGIVVDDAIMVLENIVRHREMKKGRVRAARDGAVEIGFAALAATVAVVAIFLPVAFMKGLIGKYFFQFGVTISVAVLLSLLEALTLAPMRCSQFLYVGPRATKFGRGVELVLEKLAIAYRLVLPQALRYRWLVLVGSGVLVWASLTAVKSLRKELVPPQDQGSLLVRLKTPEGSSLDYTDRKMAEIEALVAAMPDVARYFGAVGGFGGGDVNSAVLFVTLKPLKQRSIDSVEKKSLSQQEFALKLRKDLSAVKGVRAFVQDLSLAGFGGRRGYPVEFNLRGPDWTTLTETVKRVKEVMEKSGLVTDVDSDFRGFVDEVHVKPDRRKAAERGVSASDIGDSIGALFGGITAGSFSRGGNRYDVRVRLLGAERADPADIRKIMLRNNRGELVPLADIASVEVEKGVTSITRQDRERAISIYGNLAPKVSQADAIARLQRDVSSILPNGYRIVPGGSSSSLSEAFGGLTFALLLGIAVAYMVLAAQFNSFIHPVTVLLALPFSITGAFLALRLMDQSINIYSAIGIILLTGIVKKNSILLVDFTNQKREEGLGVREALIEACPTRLRPILMTSISTIVAAIPAAMTLGPGAESRAPMAVAVIGGVIVSTVLTLFVVPCFYSFVPGSFQRQTATLD
jgi:hydrophobe/amphiphile efflux-1 (HAE1) family protein